MEFTRYMWRLYADSEQGRAALASSTESFLLGDSLPPLARQAQLCERSAEGNLDPIDNEFVEANVRDDVRTSLTKDKVDSADAARTLFTGIVDEGLLMPFEREGKEYSYYLAGQEFEVEVFSNIAAFSLALYDVFPEHFAPFLFAKRFDEFAAICDSFNIPIPIVPGKTQKRERALYYSDLNEALQQFRRKYELAPKELVAFLYDFAPRVLAAEQDKDLPPPSRVWFTMGGIGNNGDFEFLDAANENTSHTWQGNVETRRGDIVLMWCVSPRSYLHSIWRATSDGFADPFSYFYSIMRIGCFSKIPAVSFKEFADDPRLSINKSVKAHFQGAGGKRFPLEDYLVLLEILRCKGCDVSNIPIPPSYAFDLPAQLEHERDVEIYLVEPLLRKLGYSESDWVRQMPLRMGRGERNFPDYAVGANLRRGDESAAFLVEAKYEIATKRQCEDAYIQTKSYALRLQARAFLLAAKEGIWLYQQSDGFSAERMRHWTWKDIEHSDRLHELSVVLGKGAASARSGRRIPATTNR